MEKRIAREAAAQAERSFQAHFNNYAIRVSFGFPTHLKNSRIIFEPIFQPAIPTSKPQTKDQIKDAQTKGNNAVIGASLGAIGIIL